MKLDKAPGEVDPPTINVETADDDPTKHNPTTAVKQSVNDNEVKVKQVKSGAVKTTSEEDEELGIYNDPSEGDDLDDTEFEIEKLRAEKAKRDEEERKAREQKEEPKEETGADGRHAGDKPDKPDKSQDKIEETPDKTFLTGGGMEVEEMLDRDQKVEEYLEKNVLPDPLHAQGVKRKAGFSQSAFSRPDHVTNMAEQLEESINASRLALESREAMFRRAMSLLSARCTSVKQDQTEGGLPFGIQSPKYFYVTQDKPLPMEPLKAWRGYNGNVYFEPIQINHLKVDETEVLRAKTSVPRTRQKLTAKLASQQQQRLAITDKENKSESRSESRQTNKSTQSNTSTARQMAILDRQMVAHRLNDNIHEDMIWIEGQENTGSLAIRPRSHPDRKARERDLQYNKERIKKGSVVHKLYEERKAKQRPKLTVSGGKFTPPTSMSPLLRTQTQYSLSHRLTTNSPDPYHGDAKLPPLDHLRASLKHMNTKASPVTKGYSRSVTLTDDMKPFIKYSPEVVAKFSQQAAL